MKKLAVLFPGIGYHYDKPLLYYSKKCLSAYGYEIIEVNCELPRLNTPYLKSRLLGCLRIRLRRLIFKSPPIARQSLFL